MKKAKRERGRGRERGTGSQTEMMWGKAAKGNISETDGDGPEGWEAFSAGARWQKPQRCPPKKSSREGRFKSQNKKRWEGGEKKKRQKSKFTNRQMYFSSSCSTLHLCSLCDSPPDLTLLWASMSWLASGDNQVFFFGASSSWEDDREEKRRTSASVCLSLSCKQAEKRCCDHWAVLLSELWDRKICPPPPPLLLCGEEENGWREEMYLTGEEGGCQPQEETAERGDRRGQGGQEERKRGREDRKARKQGRRGETGEWTRRWRKGKGRGDKEGNNKIRTGKVSKRKGVEPRKWGQEKKIQGDKERARKEEEKR